MKTTSPPDDGLLRNGHGWWSPKLLLWLWVILLVAVPWVLRGNSGGSGFRGVWHACVRLVLQSGVAGICAWVALVGVSAYLCWSRRKMVSRHGRRTQVAALGAAFLFFVYANCVLPLFTCPTADELATRREVVLQSSFAFGLGTALVVACVLASSSVRERQAPASAIEWLLAGLLMLQFALAWAYLLFVFG